MQLYIRATLNIATFPSFDKVQQTVEEIYLFDTPKGHVWIRSKACFQETDENGNTKKVKKEGLVIGDMQLSEYARVFDESCSEYDRNPEYSLFLLQSRQNVANQLLKVRGYLFLNDIYRELGMPETKAGQVVGWLDDDSPDAKDGHIDLRITETYRRIDDDTVETIYIIDPNVDGPILDTFERQ